MTSDATISKPMKAILALCLEWHEAGQDMPALRWDTPADKASDSRILRRLEKRELIVRRRTGRSFTRLLRLHGSEVGARIFQRL